MSVRYSQWLCGRSFVLSVRALKECVAMFNWSAGDSQWWWWCPMQNICTLCVYFKGPLAMSCYVGKFLKNGLLGTRLFELPFAGECLLVYG